jgi:hypothetical protein
VPRLSPERQTCLLGPLLALGGTTCDTGRECGVPGLQRGQGRVPLCLPMEWRAEVEEREFRLGERWREEPMTDLPIRDPDQIRQDCTRKLLVVQVSDHFQAILGCLLGEEVEQREFRLAEG